MERAPLRQSNTGTHSKRACELRTSARFGKYLKESSTGKLSINRGAVSDAARYDGRWVITTNDDTLSAEDLALGYKQLMRVEDCWRTLKSGIRLRPVFHWAPWRSHAHGTISVLALLLDRIAEERASDTWRNVRAQLERIQVVEYDLGDARIRQATELRPEVTPLLRKLKVPAPPELDAIDHLPAAGASA